MADHTGIEWTDATWNPVVGCTIVSPGCTNCYAMGQARRIQKMTEGRTGDPADTHYFGTTQVVKGKPVWTGRVRLAPDDILTQPLRWTKPRRIFVNSMGDLFHEDVPDEWINRVFAVMALAPQHTFQVLTKRSARMRAYFEARKPYMIARRCLDLVIASPAEHGHRMAKASWPVVSEGDPEDPSDVTLARWPLPNVWLGVSAEDQTRADERIPDLLATPAAVRFVSAEPLLGPIDLTEIAVARPDLRAFVVLDTLRGTGGFDGRPGRLDWVIVGGESGPGARPMHPDWARAIRDQCAAAHVPFFFKQWGDWAPWDDDNWSLPDGADDVEASDRVHSVGGVDFLRVGKHRAGRRLDGRTHDEMPERPNG